MVCFQYKVRFRYNFWVIRIMRWQYFEFIPCVESMADEHFSAQKRVTWIPESFSEIFHWGTSNFSDFDIVANDFLTSYDQKWPDSSSWIPRFLHVKSKKYFKNPFLIETHFFQSLPKQFRNGIHLCLRE